MTEIYLKKTGDWMKVVAESSLKIKLTVENPYFTEAESFTLDVTLPMSIVENRAFFGNIQRMDSRKENVDIKCRLLVDGRTILDGSARITQVTDALVKIQMLGGRSEINFLGEKEYIDELPLGTLTALGGHGTADIGAAMSKVHDETTDSVASRDQFKLIDIAKKIISYYGFTVNSCCLDVVPWNSLYVATAKETWEVAHVLPHWTPKEFFTEFCHFFNITLVINQVTRKVDIVSFPDYFRNGEVIEIQPEEEYTSEVAEEASVNSLCDDDIEYDLSDSDGHDYDVIPADVRENANTEEYADAAALVARYAEMTDDERKKTILNGPNGRWTGWIHDMSDWGESSETSQTLIDAMGPLQRGSEKRTSLKICPVAIAMIERTRFNYTDRHFIPTLANPTGNEINHSRQGITVAQMATIQEYVEGEETIEKPEKEDRLQVMFLDGVAQTYSTEDSYNPGVYQERTHYAGFIDPDYKASHRGSRHRSWSLSLNGSLADYHMGSLHNNGFSYNVKAKTTFKFLAKQLPDPTKKFMIRGKLYGCEKIEASVTAEGMDELVTGYFYEFIES